MPLFRVQDHTWFGCLEFFKLRSLLIKPVFVLAKIYYLVFPSFSSLILYIWVPHFQSLAFSVNSSVYLHNRISNQIYQQNKLVSQEKKISHFLNHPGKYLLDPAYILDEILSQNVFVLPWCSKSSFRANMPSRKQRESSVFLPSLKYLLWGSPHQLLAKLQRGQPPKCCPSGLATRLGDYHAFFRHGHKYLFSC